MKQAITDYLVSLEDKGKSGYDARKRAEAHILPELGGIEVIRLTTEQLHDWHVNLARRLPRVRTTAGDDQQHQRDENSDADEWRPSFRDCEITYTRGINILERLNA